jgi:hypothetical protein
MNRAVLALVPLALLLGIKGDAHAEIIVDQSLPANPSGQFGLFSNGVNSGSGDRQEIASGFVLASDAVVKDVQWFGAYRFGSTPTTATTFTFRFFADSNSLPGTLINQQDTRVTGVLTGFNNSGGLPILEYDSPISPVSLHAGSGSIFWISILENDPSTTFANHWAWQFSGVKSVPFAGSGTDGLSWSSSSEFPSMAFSLSGTTVPAPPSIILLGIGVVGLLAWRQKQAVA